MNDHYLRRKREEGVSEEELLVEARAEKREQRDVAYNKEDIDLALFTSRLTKIR